MEVLVIILGVLMVVCGASCTFTPLATFLEAGYFIAILMFVYGAAGVVRSIAVKEYGLQFLFSVVSIAVGIVVLAVPGLKLMLDGMLVYLTAGWFVIQGIVSIYLSLKFKGVNGGKKWIAALIFGIVGVILGIVSFVYPGMLMAAMGVMIGIYFMVTGFNMISAAMAK